MIEQWRPIANYEGLYEVSDLGRVRSCERRVKNGTGDRRVRERVRKLGLDRNGYLCVVLYRDDKPKPCSVHRLVAEAFLGPCPKGMEVAHEDGVRSNASALNLSYKTPAENNEDKKRHGTDACGERHPQAKITKHEVIDVLWLCSQRVPQRSVAALYGVSQSAVSLIARGVNWAHI